MTSSTHLIRATGPSAIDRSVLGEWLPGDPGAIDALLVVYRDSAQADIAILRECLGRGDLATLVRTAHKLRGGALAMGAPGLAKAASAMEAAGREGDSAACGSIMADVEEHMARMAAEVVDPG